MKDFVSAYGSHVVALFASLSVVWTLFRLPGFPWTGLLWASLAVAAAILLRARSRRSITQVIQDVDAEPARVLAVPARAGNPGPKAVL
jgi:hypothetical protein